MRWRALQTGRIYIRQNPDDDHLSIEELRDMVGREGENFSNRILHFAASLRGTRQYWLKQRSRLVAMVDNLGMPTIFFTHSAADFQWPELAHLFSCVNSAADQSNAIIENPALADWLFYHRFGKFFEVFYVEILGATDYWFHFEWQHRGSPHIHGLAWLNNAPDVEQILTLSDESSVSRKEELIKFIDSIVKTINPAVLLDGSNLDNAPPPRVNPHICSKSYTEVEDYQQDLIDLISTCQRHTRCSTSYCLRNKQGQQACRFGYPKPLQPQTAIVTENDQLELLTARNDSLINSYNAIQLSGWRANVDMKYIVSKQKVVEYCAKYATKCEPRSESMREIFQKIVNSLKDGNSSLTVVQKLLINSIGERDYSAQETCHLLLQLPMFKASQDFIVLSLDGSRMVDENYQEGQQATVPSVLDHYVTRPSTPVFNDMTLFTFASTYCMSKQSSTEPTRRRKDVIVIVRPYCPSDHDAPTHEQYCRQQLMLHMSFRQISDILGEHDTYAEAYATFLLSTGAPSNSLQDDVRRLEEHQICSDDESDNDQVMYVLICNVC